MEKQITLYTYIQRDIIRSQEVMKHCTDAHLNVGDHPNIMQQEVSQTQKVTYCMTPLI